jgi:DNA-binding CsgD family transcriptional regulator
MPVNMIIQNDHPTLQLKEKIQEVTNTFLQQKNLNYFQYLRCFSNGNVSLLTTNTGAVEYFSQIKNEPVIFSSYREEHENCGTYWFLWDEELPETPVTIAREKFGLHHGITLVRRHKDYYDMIAVALPEPQSNAGSFYLNKLKPIEHFIHFFDKEYKDLLDIATKNPIVLPKPYRDVNYQKLCLPDGRLPITGLYGETYLTAQELSCLRLRCAGLSTKQVAQTLSLSPRTVETYIHRIQTRTGYTNKKLENLIFLCP